MSGDIIAVEPGGAVVLRTEDEGAWSRTELAASGTWPSWNPVHDVVAVSSIENNGDELRSVLSVVPTDGSDARIVYRTPSGAPPVIAERLPHYVQWSPGGGVLSYVAQGTMGLTLHLSPAFEQSEGTEGDPIITGAPIFHAWCPDDNFVAIHSGQEVSVIEAEGSRTTAMVSEQGMGFRTPAFDDAAEYMYFSIAGPRRVNVMRALFQGTQATSIARFGAGVVFLPRPGSHELGVALSSVPDTGAFDRIAILTPDGEEAGSISGPFVAAFWSPDGSRAALIVPMWTGDGRYALHIRSREGKLLCASEPFFVSADLQMMLGFFDQYSHSHSLWARDSGSVVITGRRGIDGVPITLGDGVASWAMRFNVDTGGPFEVLFPADLAFYRPRRITVV